MPSWQWGLLRAIWALKALANPDDGPVTWFLICQKRVSRKEESVSGKEASVSRYEKSVPRTCLGPKDGPLTFAFRV